jgi:hypothetical protein
MGQLIHFSGMARLSEDDLRALEKAASIIDVHPDWLAAVMQFESGFDTKAVNRLSGATGLIQFMPSTAARLKTSTDALKKMSFIQQLEYVIKYFGEKAGLRSLEDTYLKVFYPDAIKMNLDSVVASEGSKVYEQNKVFDTTGKGYITKRDITSTIRSVYNKGLQNGYINVSPLQA